MNDPFGIMQMQHHNATIELLKEIVNRILALEGALKQIEAKMSYFETNDERRGD